LLYFLTQFFKHTIFLTQFDFLGFFHDKNFKTDEFINLRAFELFNSRNFLLKQTWSSKIYKLQYFLKSTTNVNTKNLGDQTQSNLENLSSLYLAQKLFDNPKSYCLQPC